MSDERNKEYEDRLAKDIARELKDQVMQEFYENVGKSVLKKLFGLVLVGIGGLALVLMVKLGMIKI